MAVGPLQALEPIYRSRLFWQNTMAEIALVHAMVIAAILLSIYSLRRHQVNYLRLGMGALGFSIIMLTYMLPPMPGWFYPLWRSIHIGGIGLFTVGAWLFLIGEAQPSNRWFPRLCMFWSAIGPLVYLVHFILTDITFYKWFETAWGGISGLIGLYPVALLAHSIWRQWAWRKFIFILATMCAIVMGIADILLQGTARSALGSTGYGLQMVSPLWFTALTVVLVLDFARSLVREDEQRKRMASELAKQEKDLVLLHEISQQREREKAALHERKRIMQDIHDGLGSQLISSLALSERGHLNAAQTSLLLRDCIDDMRLAIDALSGDDDQFIVAAGNLRFRMAPRLEAAGIQLRWDAREWSNDEAVTAAQTLPLLRIIQEAFTNTLKHASAKTLSVTLRSTARRVEVILEDDGCGFDIGSTSMGKGLHSMEKRARGIGAALEVTSTAASTVDKGGTCIQVTLLVGAHDVAHAQDS
jgi:signal transduction histidine kinase